MKFDGLLRPKFMSKLESVIETKSTFPLYGFIGATATAITIFGGKLH
jgi:hypothetical protein